MLQAYKTNMDGWTDYINVEGRGLLGIRVFMINYLQKIGY